MENKTMNVVGAAAVIAAGVAAATPASADPIPPAASYADLLQPVPDAVDRLTDADAARDAAPAQLFEAQYYGGGQAYHHHHHHHHTRRWYSQHGYYWNGRAWVLRPVRHHHHHHHHRY